MSSDCITLYSTPNPLPNRQLDATEAGCMGVGLSLQQLEDYWTSHDCITYFNNLIYTQVNGTRNYSSAAFTNVTEDLDYLFSTYFNSSPSSDGKGGHSIAVPGQVNYEPFQAILISACSNPDPGASIPGGCQVVASKMCAACSRDQIPNNGDVLRLCGCAAPPLDPAVYGVVSPGCDPLCAQGSISKQRDPVTGVVESCTDAVCVIDTVSITVSNSTVGGVDFLQVCPQCTTGQSCKCIVDTSIPGNTVATGLDNPVTFQQYCGTGSICIQINDQTGVSTTVPCDINSPQATVYNYSTPAWAWFVAALILVIGILIILAAVYAGRVITIKASPVPGDIPDVNDITAQIS